MRKGNTSFEMFPNQKGFPNTSSAIDCNQFRLRTFESLFQPGAFLLSSDHHGIASIVYFQPLWSMIHQFWLKINNEKA